MKRILFLVSGYGLGNSSRIHAIIQHLDKNYIVDVFAYGNSFKYFKQVSRVENVYQGFSLEYGIKNGKIDFFLTLKKILENFKAIYKNRRYVKSLLKSRFYNLLVSDSDFSTLFLRKRPKLISINNANIIIKKAGQIKKKGFYGQFFIETLDYLYNQFVPDLVISPFFQTFKETKKNIRQTALIVRKAFSRPLNLPKKHHVLVMTGGAGFFNQGLFINHDQKDYDLSVLAENIKISGKARREKKTYNASPLMNRATILVINGGFSSISEAVAMARPMVVIPLKAHIEQYINALWVKENNMGLLSSWDQLESAISTLKKNYSHFQKHLLNYNHLEGAKQIASLIGKELENDNMC